VLLALIMPNADGINALKRIEKIDPSAKVIVFSLLAPDYSIKIEGKRIFSNYYFENLLLFARVS
jgi:hypothetical protein